MNLTGFSQQPDRLPLRQQHRSQYIENMFRGEYGVKDWNLDGQYTGAGSSGAGGAAECHVNTSALPSSTAKAERSRSLREQVEAAIY